MSFVSVAVAGVNAYSQIQSGKLANRQANMQATQMEYMGEQEREQALQTARLIRRAGDKQTGQTRTAYAGSGVQVDEGSAADVQRQQSIDIEHDAFQTLLEGKRRASGMTTQAEIARADGSARQAASYVQAAGTVLGGVYGAAKANGWRTAGPGFSGTQAPAPVTDLSTYPGSRRY